MSFFFTTYLCLLHNYTEVLRHLNLADRRIYTNLYFLHKLINGRIVDPTLLSCPRFRVLSFNLRLFIALFFYVLIIIYCN